MKKKSVGWLPAQLLGTSALIVLPCLWSSIVTPADLQSHLYNAWLANLISLGEAPGLFVAAQNTNVLIDWIFAWGLHSGSAMATEKVVCALLVLLFFWGAVRFLRAVHHGFEWSFCPWLAILSYGLLFQAGFLNFYLASGLILWALALAWDGSVRRLMAALPLVAIAWLAHPLPVAWFVALIAYRRLAIRLAARWQAALFGAGLVVLIVTRIYLRASYPTQWKLTQIAFVTGADQVLLYGREYALVAFGILGLLISLVAGRWRQWRQLGTIESQLYGLTAAAIVIIPYAIGRAGAIGQRLSFYAFLLFVAAMGRPRHARQVLFGGLAVATLFFALLFRDISSASRVKAKLVSLVAPLPAKTRVVSYLPDPPGYRVTFSHLVSSACIGHCFDFQNYEPATAQFRIRAQPGNTVAEADINVIHGMEAGLYVIQKSDPPLRILYRCGRTVLDVCIREMRVGERGMDLATVQ